MKMINTLNTMPICSNTSNAAKCKTVAQNCFVVFTKRFTKRATKRAAKRATNVIQNVLQNVLQNDAQKRNTKI